jgi:hypothetical protein
LNCGTICFVHRRSKDYPFVTPLDSAKGYRGSFFYQADKTAPSQTFVLRPFENILAETCDSWKPVNDDSTIPYVKLLAGQIAKLNHDGLKGIDTINCWVSWRIQPLQYHDHLMHQYTGVKDGMRYSEVELVPEIVAKRIRSLMKIPQKEKTLKFGMSMFENGICRQVFALNHDHAHFIFRYENTLTPRLFPSLGQIFAFSIRKPLS